MIDIEFHLSNDRVLQKFRIETIVILLSEFGGLMSTLILIFHTFGRHINMQLLLAKTIETLYYVDKYRHFANVKVRNR